ncbi:MAG: CopG family transcriptional regulator [Deltaproteobacteria bacterium]|nr:CopG family transcriptional regulator [Deltaproteobacteria bacterium]
MKNITLTLPENVARWARIWAARNEVSLSRMLSSLLEQRMREDLGYGASMDTFLGQEVRDISGGRPYPTRDEIHER